MTVDFWVYTGVCSVFSYSFIWRGRVIYFSRYFFFYFMNSYIFILFLFFAHQTIILISYASHPTCFFFRCTYIVQLYAICSCDASRAAGVGSACSFFIGTCTHSAHDIILNIRMQVSAVITRCLVVWLNALTFKLQYVYNSNCYYEQKVCCTYVLNK